MGIFDSLFDSQSRHMAKAKKLQAKVLGFEQEMSLLSDDQLKEKTNEFKKKLENCKLEDILPEAFAVVREASKRVLSEFPYPVQVLGGVLLHFGDIAEMKTGEGKTLTATMPIYLNALSGKGAHVITVNEYLATRDAQWMGEVYRFLGLTVGCNLRELSREEKKEAFLCDITYTTNSELGFDYLRDNMATSLEERVLRGLHYAIIDEVDSVLVDEARTPLIISGAGESLDNYYLQADSFAKHCKRDVDVEVKMDDHAVILTEKGVKKAEKFFQLDHIFDENHADLVHFIQNALRANFLMELDVEYVIGDDEIILVDQFTGRKMEGREFSDGLHQAIQAKEGVGIKSETKTLATITYQNFFRLYNKLSGMTGTAKTEEKEFLDTYNMRVFDIPTNRPIARIDYPDDIFRTRSEKYEAIIDEVEKIHATGQPVLIGTLSVGMSESLSAMMSRRRLVHEVLNAKEDSKEAQIIAKAGQKYAITIATNMAGRGTDIKLGDGVLELGGLVVLACERHEAKRIDNQLRGRSGRQGDPGYSRFYCSMDDDLVVKFASDLMKETIQDFMDGKCSIEKMRKMMDQLQSRAEGLHFDTRKQVLEFDDVLMEQRKLIFTQRDEILAMDNISSMMDMWFERSMESLEVIARQQQKAQLFEIGKRYGFSEEQLIEGLERPSIISQTWAKGLLEQYHKKVEGVETIHQWEKMVFLQMLDHFWIEHVDNMDRVKKGIHLRSYAQEKPIDAFKKEAYERFGNMMNNVIENFVLSCAVLQLPKEV